MIIITLKNTMKNTLLALVLILIPVLSFAQTENENLNAQLKKMRGHLLSENYENFSDYTYPKVIEMMGGKSSMIQATRQSMDQMKKEGFVFKEIKFKDPLSFLKKDGELQCSLTQQITMQVPNGKVQAEYTLLAISQDNGTNWTFIDTSGKSKETMLKYFPNLHKDIIVKPKTQKMIE